MYCVAIGYTVNRSTLFVVRSCMLELALWQCTCIYIVPCSHNIFYLQADVCVGDGGSSGESDMESEPRAERAGERVTMETIHDWVQSATGKVSEQCLYMYMHGTVHVVCGEVL